MMSVLAVASRSIKALGGGLWQSTNYFIEINHA
jgi:hypothetical protein